MTTSAEHPDPATGVDEPLSGRQLGAGLPRDVVGLPDVLAATGSAESLIGRRLGRYRVGEILHQGPMSTLFRATDVRLGRPVALKVIAPALAGDEEFRARFIDEARNTSAIDHPHVVPVFDSDESDDGHLYLAMRLVDGPSLADLIAGHPLPAARVLDLGDQVAAALDAVHAHGLVHLDLKPANILVTTTGHSRLERDGEARDYVYLADFGLTRRGAAPAATVTGAFLGSPAYAAPEHLRGQAVTPATDLYSLGCVLHTALTGRAPYLGSVEEVIAGHLSGSPVVAAGALRSRHRAAPEPGLAVGAATDAVLGRALALEPAGRPATAAELITELRAALAHDAEPSRPRPKPAPRHPPRPAAALAPLPARSPAPDAAQPGDDHAPDLWRPSRPWSVSPGRMSPAPASPPATSARVPAAPAPIRPAHTMAAAAAARRTTHPVAPCTANPFTGPAPRPRWRHLHDTVAVAVAVFAVLLAVGLALFLH